MFFCILHKKRLPANFLEKCQKPGFFIIGWMAAEVLRLRSRWLLSAVQPNEQRQLRGAEVTDHCPTAFAVNHNGEQCSTGGCYLCVQRADSGDENAGKPTEKKVFSS